MKYELVPVEGSELFRVRALRDIPRVGVRAGDLGGLGGERENNLSQDGDAWIDGNARVSDSAWVSDSARVYGRARVFGDVRVSGDAQVLSWQHVFPLANTPWGPLILVRQRDGSGVLQCGCQMFGLDDDPVQVAVRALDTVDQEVRLPDLLVALVPQLRSTARAVVDSW